MSAINRRWAESSVLRRVLFVVGVSFLVVSIWIGQGVMSVFGQHDAYAEYWIDRAADPGEILYVALGDSAAQGVGATDADEGYVGQLVDHVEAATEASVQVVNLSVTGARTLDVIEDQLPQFESLVAEVGMPDLVTLAIGGNDATNTDPDVFAEQFDQLLEELPAGTLVADLPDFQSGPRLAASRELSAVAREVIARYPDLIPVALETSTAPNTILDYAPDFFHPDNSGYERWATAFVAQMPETLGGEGVDPAAEVFASGSSDS